jgi:hypothetical protein
MDIFSSSHLYLLLPACEALTDVIDSETSRLFHVSGSVTRPTLPIRQKSRETRGPAEYRGLRFGADPAERSRGALYVAGLENSAGRARNRSGRILLAGCDSTGQRHRRELRSADQIPVRLGVGRLLVFGVLAPSNAAVANGIRLDLTLTLHSVHMQPRGVKYHALSVSCEVLCQNFCTFG